MSSLKDRLTARVPRPPCTNLKERALQPRVYTQEQVAILNPEIAAEGWDDVGTFSPRPKGSWFTDYTRRRDLNIMLGWYAAAGASGSVAYSVGDSCVLNGTSDYFSRTPGGASSRTTYSLRAMVKRAKLSTSQFLFSAGTSGIFYICFNSDDTFTIASVDGSGSAALTTTQVFRDITAWYDILIAVDTNNGTAANRVRLYVNGVEITSFGTRNNPSSGATGNWNNTVVHAIGRNSNGSSDYSNLYVAEVCEINNVQCTPTAFGEFATSGVWRPKSPLTNTFGTNGFYLNFSNSASMGADSSGNSNTWTLNGSLGSGSQRIDTPTTNYATLNPLVASAANISGGMLISGTTAAQGTINALLINSYWEVVAGGSNVTAGVISASGTTNTTTVTANKTFGFRLSTAGALDYINITDAGSWTSITTGLVGSQFPYSVTAAATWNFGQKAFVGSIPATYKALNTANLATPAIVKGDDHFHVEAGISKSGSTVSFTLPWDANTYDTLFWVKRTDSSAGTSDWYCIDGVRGYNVWVKLNTTTVETTDANVLAVSGSMVTLGSTLTSSATYEVFAWKAGLSASRITNTSGSITTTVSVNTTSGFAIILYTGTGSAATLGHSLPAAPYWYHIHGRSGAGSYNSISYHASVGATKATWLNLTLAASASAAYFNNTAPTSTVLSIGSDGDVNTASGTYVCYAHTPIAGYSAFDGYTGNGNADGPVDTTMFSPAASILKRTDGTSDWRLYDYKRNGYNADSNILYPNLSNANDTGAGQIDFLATGLKLRDTVAGQNASSGTYITANWAITPFGGLNATPATAR